MSKNKESIPTQDFLNKTIFVISSPQEAIGLLLLSNGRSIEHCVLVKYIGYSDGKYSKIIERILSEGKINNLYILNLYLHNTSMNNGFMFLTSKEIIFNKLIIRKFDSERFQGKLFESEYNFVAQINSPFLTLGKYDLNRIYVMEHSPADARARIRRRRNVLEIIDVKTNCEKILFYLHEGWGGWCSLVKIAKRRVVCKVVTTLFPYMNALQYLEKGFSWIDYGDDFLLMDYRSLNIDFNLFMAVRHSSNEHKTLVLIEHKEAFKHVADLYDEMRKIDFIEMYADILQKHVSIGETIVCKFHPYIFQNSSDLEISNYARSMKTRFLAMGYRKVLFFDEIFQNELISSMPVEMFIKPLKINKIVGIYSSTMVIVQDWDDITVISDCSWIEGFRRMRNSDKEIFSNRFTEA